MKPSSPRRSYHAARPYKQKRQRPAARKGSAIHESKYINKAIAPAHDTPYEPTHTFRDFGLNQRLTSTLEYLKFTTPTAIQDQAIPPALKQQDVIGLANTGTGKTAAFLLPIIEHLSMHRTPVSVLILAPTRELALQIDQEFRQFSAGQKLYSALLVGGANIGRQIRQVERGPHVIIGTPGRVKDLIGRNILRLSSVSQFVLDEADRMCDMGFVRDIRHIASELPRERQTYCFSATMTADVQVIVEEFMRQPITISVAKNQTSEHIEQDIVRFADRDHKIERLTNILRTPDIEKVIIFGETKFGVQRLTDKLNKIGFSAAAIHGNKSQSQRDQALRRFKAGDVAILAATDVAARGLDIPNVSHVINFDQPQCYSDYIHRIGRTGRAGNQGLALTFVPEKSATQPRTPAKKRDITRTAQPKNQFKAPTRKRRAPSSRDTENRLVDLANSR